VLRSGAGAHFRSHSIVMDVAWQQVPSYLSKEAGLLIVNSSHVGGDDRLTANVDKQWGKNKTATSDISQLSVVKFDLMNCAGDTVLLVSSGLTPDACQFAANVSGELVSFPSIDGKSVMNAAVSGSVALFEIVRHLRLQAADVDACQ